MNAAGRLYLDLVCATDYPEQEPAAERAQLRDLLWLLVPICGPVLFCMAVEGRA